MIAVLFPRLTTLELRGNDGEILPEMNALEKVTLTYNNVKIDFPKESVQNMF